MTVRDLSHASRTIWPTPYIRVTNWSPSIYGSRFGQSPIDGPRFGLPHNPRRPLTHEKSLAVTNVSVAVHPLRRFGQPPRPSQPASQLIARNSRPMALGLEGPTSSKNWARNCHMTMRDLSHASRTIWPNPYLRTKIWPTPYLRAKIWPIAYQRATVWPTP